MEESYLKFLPEILGEMTPTQLQAQINKNLKSGAKILLPPNTSKDKLCLIAKKLMIDSFLAGEYDKYEQLRWDKAEAIYTSLVTPYFKDPKEQRKIYVIQKDFFSRFKKVDMQELCFSHLPSKEMKGYVELPDTIEDEDGMKIKGFFFFIGDAKKAANPLWNPTSWSKQEKSYEVSDKIVGFAYSSDNLQINAFSWTHIPIDLDIKIVDSRKDVKYIETLSAVVKERICNDYPNYLALMYNLLAYLNTGAPDIRSYKNVIRYQSSTSSTPVKADKHLSNSTIIQVGFSFKKENMSHVGEWPSMPYMRWQKCGKGLTEIRLVFVKGSTKHRKAL